MQIEPEHWPAVSALLDEALVLPATLRRAWLAAMPDNTHRATLERLLVNHARVETADFLNTFPHLALADEAEDSDPQQATADNVGPYRLLHELGRGGMGTVWLAERSDGSLKRPVALKLPHPGLATSVFAERLARERDILASLSHPNIARLYDAGVTGEGQPFLALEYVQGKNLIEHCDTLRLGLRGRIQLFQQVLAAVQHAHAHLVIHRDIKPSNVLVDEHGQVRLLDFGIAKLMSDGRASETELTHHWGRALTLDFASPEQIGGQTLNTSSDIYSLGVLLYQLLTGERPYRLTRSTPAAIEEAILATDIRKPSDTQSTEAQATARGLSAARLARALRGDLDTIILKALKKEPAARYATADAFRQDLQLHLDGSPVLARRDTLAYRARKFVRRHRVGVSATGLVALALGVGLVSTAWQAGRANEQAARARAVQDFLIGLFNEADPVKAQGRELSARQMLDRGRHDLHAKFAGQPQLEGLMDGVLAELYTKLGDESKALPLAEARRDLTLSLEGPQSLAYGDALYSLARAHGGMSHHALAYETYAQAAEVLRHHAPERAAELLLIEAHSTTQLAMLDRTVEAVDRLRPLLPRLEAHFGADSWELLRFQASLAGTYSDQDQHALAAALIAQIVPKLERVEAAHALDVNELRADLGYALWNARQYPAAEDLLRRAIADADRLLGPANTLSVLAQRTLGLALSSQGKFSEAARIFDDSVQRAVKLGGEDYAPTRYAQSFDVPALVMTGRFDEALSMAARSVRDVDKVEGLTPAVVRGFRRRLGLALIFTSESAKAVTVLEDLLAEEQQAGVTKGGAHGTTLLYLAGALARQGRHDAAAKAAQQAALSFEQGPLNNAAVAHSKLTEALAQARLHQSAATQELIEQAQTLLAKIVQPNQTDPLFVQLVQAEVLLRNGFAVPSERLDRSAREQLGAIGGVSLPRELPLVF